MFFGLSQDQELLARAAYGALSEIARRKDATDVNGRLQQDGSTTADTWSAITSGGWHEVMFGDSESRGLDSALLAEQAGRAALPFSFTDHCIAAPSVLRLPGSSGSSLNIARDQMWTVAGVEAAVDGLRGLTPLVAERTGSGWGLNGWAPHVPGDHSAAGVIAVARELETGDLGVFSVESRDGLSYSPKASVDFRCPASHVHFRDVRVPLDHRLPVESLGTLIAWGSMATCAELLGAAVALEEMTVTYAKNRQQFGKAIGAFQAVKHHCANIHVRVEAMRVSVWNAALALDTEPGSAGSAISIAKSYCGPSALAVGRLALQVHGGVGFTWEHPLHLYLKRVMRLASAYGDARWHRERLARNYIDGLVPAQESTNSVIPAKS